MYSTISKYLVKKKEKKRDKYDNKELCVLISPVSSGSQNIKSFCCCRV